MSAKNLNAEHLNIAYDELMMWGPRLGMPLQPRILERIPAISAETATDLERECYAAQLLANDLFERVYGNELPEVEARVLLIKTFAWIDEANYSRAYNQGMYFAWHD